MAHPFEPKYDFSKLKDRYTAVDTETFGPLDLPAVGSTGYLTPATAAIRSIHIKRSVDAGPKNWAPEIVPELPDWLREVFEDPTMPIIVHNKPFDGPVLMKLGARYGIKIVGGMNRFVDVQAWCRYYNLPPSLEKAAPAVGLNIEKDRAGKALLRFWSRPEGATNKNPAGNGRMISARENLDSFDQLLRYGDRDVMVTEALFLALDPPPAHERKWEAATLAMDARGVAVDSAAAKAFVEISKVFIDRATRRAEQATGFKPTQVKAAVEAFGYPNLSADTVTSLLTRTDLPEPERIFLEARQLVSRAAPKKAQAILDRAVNGRVHDNFLYCGTHTHRVASTGIQLQNIPRGELSAAQISLVIETALRYDAESAADILTMAFEDPANALSSSMRSLFMAGAGKRLSAPDYSQIELRLDWLFSGEFEALARLAGGEDEYKRFAAEVMFGISVADVTKFQRQAAKAAVLGCGYSLGVDTFVTQTGMSEDIARLGVYGYRSAYPGVPKFWADIENAAVQAQRTQSRVEFIPHIPSIGFEPGPRGTLMLTRPSGSALYYNNPRTEPFQEKGRRGYKLVYDQVKGGGYVRKDSYGGLLTEHVCSSVARDLMMGSLARGEEWGYAPVMTVHDEVVFETGPEITDDQTTECLLTLPFWAEGWAIGAEGGSGARYGKF